MIGEKTDLETIDRITEQLARFIVMLFIFRKSRQNLSLLDRSFDSDSTDSRSLQRQFLEFSSLDRPDSELTESQRLIKAERFASPNVRSSQSWEQGHEDKWTPAYKKLTKKLSSFQAEQRAELVDYLWDKLRNGT